MHRLTIRGLKPTPATPLARHDRWFRAVLWVVFAAVLASGFSVSAVAASPASPVAATLPSVSKQDLEKKLADIKAELSRKESALASAVGADRTKLQTEIAKLKSDRDTVEKQIEEYASLIANLNMPRLNYQQKGITFGTDPFVDASQANLQNQAKILFDAEFAITSKGYDLAPTVKKVTCLSSVWYVSVSLTAVCAPPVVNPAELAGFKKLHPASVSAISEQTKLAHERSLDRIAALSKGQVDWIRQGIGGPSRVTAKANVITLESWRKEIQSLLDITKKKLEDDKTANKASEAAQKELNDTARWWVSIEQTNVRNFAKNTKSDEGYAAWQAALKKLYDVEQAYLSKGAELVPSVSAKIEGGKIVGYVPLNEVLGCGNNCGTAPASANAAGLTISAASSTRTDSGTGPFCVRYKQQLADAAKAGDVSSDPSVCNGPTPAPALTVKVAVSGAAVYAVEKGAIWFQVVAPDRRTSAWMKLTSDSKGGFSGTVPEGFALDYGVAYEIRVAATSQNSITAEMQRATPPTPTCTSSTPSTNCVLAASTATITSATRSFTPVPTTTPRPPTTTTTVPPAGTGGGAGAGAGNGNGAAAGSGNNGGTASDESIPTGTWVGPDRVGGGASSAGGETFDIVQDEYGTATNDASQTIFGRFFSGDATEMGKVQTGATSPPMACLGADATAGNVNKDACFVKYSVSPEQLLPAWRWRDDVALYSNVPGLDGIAATLYSFLASTTFTLSQLVWWMLLEVTQWALTDNLVERAGHAMNRGYLLFVDVLNASGIFFLLAALGLLVLARLFLRGRLIKVFSLVFAFIVPIAVMQGLAVRAAQVNNAPAPSWGAQPLPTASPAWFAVRGVNVVDGFSTWISSGLGRLSTVSGSLQVQEASLVDPSCASYVAALYDQYYAYSSAPVRNIKENAARTYQEGYAALQKSYVEQGGGSASNWALIGSKVAGPLEYNAVQASKPASLENWSAALASRTTAEKLADARFYKVATVSQLWHRAFLGSWQSAQFGNQAYGARMYCHMLESNADINPIEQGAIASIAGRYSYVRLPDGTLTQSPGYDGVSLGVFESGTNALDKEQRILAWAACNRVLVDPAANTWEWRAAPGWDSFGNGKKVSDTDCREYFTNNLSNSTKVKNFLSNKGADITEFLTDYGCGLDSVGNLIKTIGTGGGNCLLSFGDSVVSSIPIVGSWLAPSAWADKLVDGMRPDTFAPLKFKDNEEVDEAVAAAASEAAKDEENPRDPVLAYGTAKDAGKTVLSLKGHNGPQRLTLAILALVTSILYAYAIGFLALGTFFAKIGLVIMIMMLPGTLLLLAVPSARAAGDGGAQKMGQKMLRMTAGFVLSHGMLSFVLGLLLSVMLVLESFVGGTGQGVGGGFVHGLIPITALFVVRAVLKAAGLGDIASAQGALGMPLSAALRAGGKDMQALGMRKFSSAADKAGLNKFDAAAKKIGKRAALAVPKAAGRTAKSWGRKAGDMMGLPEAKSYLLGKRDPVTGKLTRAGLRHRFTTFTGLVGLANGARRIDQSALGRLAAKTAPGRALGRFGSRVGAGFNSRFPLPGKAWNAFMEHPAVAKRIQGSKRELAEARQSRQEWQKVAFRFKDGRSAAREKFATAEAEEILARDFADRYGKGMLDADGKPVAEGTIIRTSDGRTVYAYKASRKLRDADGNVLKDDAGRDLYAVETFDSTGRPVRISTKDLAARKGLEAQMDTSGNPVLDAAGNPVYGYRFDDGRGTRVVSHEEYERLRSGVDGMPPVPASAFTTLTDKDKDAYKAGVRYVHNKDAGVSLLRHADVLALADDAERLAALAAPVTEFDDFRTHFTEEEIWAGAEAFREKHGLRKGQFVVSPFGLPVLRPTLESADGKNRFVIGKYLEESRELAAFERTQYLPNHQKMMLPGETAAQYSMRLKMMEKYLGGFGPNGEKIDIVYERTGHKFDSPRGQHELQLALEGKEGALSSWRPEIPPEVFNAMVMTSSSRSYHTYNTDIKDDYNALATERNRMMAETHLSVVESDRAIVQSYTEFDELGKLLRAIPGKLSATRTDLRKIETDNGPLLTAVASATAALKAKMDEYTSSPHYSAATKSWDTSTDPSLVIMEKELLDAVKALENAKIDTEIAAGEAGRVYAEKKDEEAQIMEELTQTVKRAKELSADIHERGQVAEAAGKELYFGHMALLRDKGRVDWSEIDSEIDDFVKEFANRWGAIGQNMESVIAALEAAALSGEATRTRMAYEELDAVVKETRRAASKAAASGSGYHLKIRHELAMLEGDSHSYGVTTESPSIRSVLRKGRR
jgi:hypothetical protein